MVYQFKSIYGKQNNLLLYKDSVEIHYLDFILKSRQETTGFAALIQFLPLIVMLLFSILGSFSYSDPVYSTMRHSLVYMVVFLFMLNQILRHIY